MRLFIFLVLGLVFKTVAQENYIATVKDAYLNLATDARAAGVADIGVATSTDAFSQYWNPAKYIFSDKKSEIGVTQFTNLNSNIKQVNFSFYNNIDNRNAYAIGIRNYTTSLQQFDDFGNAFGSQEVAIDGSYALRLSDVFAMSVTGRFIALKGKTPLSYSYSGSDSVGLYGIDVAGYYTSNEVAFKKINGRWRAGFNFSNLRGKSEYDNTDVEIYAPSLFKAGAGFDFIVDYDRQLAITAEYKMLLDSYTEFENGQKLDFGLEGSVLAFGFEFTYREKLILRTGYSQGIDRQTDTFGALGVGFRSNYAYIDVAVLIGVSTEENLARENLRISLSLNLRELLSISLEAP